MPNCIFCSNEVKPTDPPEHVLLDALGGRFTVGETVCGPCNHKLGGGPDRALAESVQDIRLLMSFKSGRRNTAPPIRNVQTGQGRVTLNPGGVPKFEKPGPIEVDQDFIRLRVRNKQDVNAYVRHVARRIKRPVSETMDILSRGQWRLHRTPIGVTNRHLGLGGTLPIRAMAKACLLLWASHIGNDEIRAGRYDGIRQYVLSGTDEETKHLSRLDTREWPIDHPLRSAYGEFANVIYVCSNRSGRVLAYFRLYGALGWRIELAPAGAMPSVSVGFASNPENPAQWSKGLHGEHPLDFDWIDNATYESGMDAPRSALARMLQIHQSNAYRVEWMRITDSVFNRRGIRADDLISDDDRRSILSEITHHFTMVLLRMPTSRALSEAEIQDLMGLDRGCDPK